MFRQRCNLVHIALILDQNKVSSVAREELISTRAVLGLIFTLQLCVMTDPGQLKETEMWCRCKKDSETEGCGTQQAAEGARALGSGKKGGGGGALPLLIMREPRPFIHCTYTIHDAEQWWRGVAWRAPRT